MLLGTGVSKKLVIARQAAQGVKAPANSANARYGRRVTSTLDLTRPTFTSAEINESQQDRDVRLGVKSVGGTLTGELSVGGYQPHFEGLLRQLAVAGATTGVAVTDIAAATVGDVGSRTGTFTRGAGSFLADGFKRNDIVRATGFTAPAVGNNNRNFVIIDVTDTVMTVFALDKNDVVAKAAGDPIQITAPGRKIWTPTTGQTRDYFTIEHQHVDVGVYEAFRDCVFTGATVTITPTGMATVAFPILGLGMDNDAVPWFQTPAAAPVGGLLAGPNGVLIINGAAAAIVTGLTLTIAGNHSAPGGVIGSDENPDIFPGKLTVTGSLTALFANATYRDMFLNETEGTLCSVLTANKALNSPFTAFQMSRVKYTGASKDDVPTGLTQTLPFQALENVTGGGALLRDLMTTLSIQDSAFV